MCIFLLLVGVFSSLERRLRLTGFSVFLCEMGVRTGRNKRFVFYVCVVTTYLHQFTLVDVVIMLVSWFRCNTRCLTAYR